MVQITLLNNQGLQAAFAELGVAEANYVQSGRMAKVGNWSNLEQARQQAFLSDATVQLARARHNGVATQERLTRLLGLWGAETNFTLPDRLPEFPSEPSDINNIESQAVEQRRDIQMAKRDTIATAKALGLTRVSGFVNVLDAGYANKSQSRQPRENGYEISLELPIFDWGNSRNVKAESLYQEAF